MIIGAHTAKAVDHNIQRMIATNNNWGCLQTHFGGPQSYVVPAEMRLPYYDKSTTPLWIWHAAFTSSINPGMNCRQGCAEYLRAVLIFARKFSIHSVVIHTGAVSGKTVKSVLDGISDFLINYGVWNCVNKGNTKLAVEMSACTCGMSLSPEIFAEVYSETKIGWCLDLAHSHAAGLGWSSLRGIIEKYPPVVCHANFPGSAFGSSRDVHGWRTTPEKEALGRNKIIYRTNSKLLTNEYDETIRLLVSKNVPLIVEGSGFTDGNIESEIAFLRTLV